MTTEYTAAVDFSEEEVSESEVGSEDVLSFDEMNSEVQDNVLNGVSDNKKVELGTTIEEKYIEFNGEYYEVSEVEGVHSDSQGYYRLLLILIVLSVLVIFGGGMLEE